MTRQIKQFLMPLTKNVFGKRGFSSAQLIFDWEKIMGSSVAAYCWPIKIQFDRDRRTHGTLHLNVLSSWALLVEQNRDLFLERMNTFFGYACVARIKIYQKSDRQPLIATGSLGTVHGGSKPLSPDQQHWIDKQLTGVDQDLRDKLTELGAQILKK